MGQNNCLHAESNTKGQKAQHQGNSGHDIRIQHGNIGDSHDNGAGDFFHIADAQTRCRADQSGNCSGNQGDDQSILQGRHNDLAVEKTFVPFQTETAPGGHIFGFIK